MHDDTCLHLAFQIDTVEVEYDFKEYLFALVYLIYKGADINAFNAAGITPSDLAWENTLEMGIIPMDAWWRYILMKCKLFTRVEDEDEGEDEDKDEDEDEGEYTRYTCCPCMIQQYLHDTRIHLGFSYWH
jgi:hypothetical protein